MKYIVMHKIRDKSTRSIALEMQVSISTVKRVWAYLLTYHEYIPLKKRGRDEKVDLGEWKPIWSTQKRL